MQKVGYVLGIFPLIHKAAYLSVYPPSFPWTMRVLGFIEIALLALQIAVRRFLPVSLPFLLRADIIV